MNWTIPKHIRHGDADQLKTAELMVKYAMTVLQLTAPFPVIMYYLGAPQAALYNLILVGLVMGSPFVMRITGSVALACHTLIMLIVAMLMGLSLFMGGLVAPTVPAALAAPVAAMFLLGARAGISWAVVCIILIVVEASAEAMGVVFPNMVTPAQALFLRSAGLASVIVFVMAFMLQFDALTRQAVSEVQIANRRVTTMIEHVETTSITLSKSAAQLLGSDDVNSKGERHEGLTQQMMTTASSSREMLDSMGESLYGMIGHYRAISQRIQDLHKQSGTIEDLVEIIDKISDRLDLMALNTGIEAAHVGVAGKRFRLLSDDMRRLAERVSAETTRIKAALRQVQQHTDAALDASMSGQSLTDDGTAKLDVMSRQFEHMYQLIESTAAASQRMSEDTRNQTTAIRRLARAGKAIG